MKKLTSSSNNPPIPLGKSTTPSPLTPPPTTTLPSTVSPQGTPTPLVSKQAVHQNTLVGKKFTLPKMTVTVEDVIAEGGFGVVYLAKSSNGSKKHGHYALKRIVVNNEKDLAVAEGEVAILASLTPLGSPHILPLIDSLTTPLNPEITEVLSLTPYCKGSLLSILNRAFAAKIPLPEQKILKIFGDIVQGVAAFHCGLSPPLIHRDLKVENILENEQTGQFVICDFGSGTFDEANPLVTPPSKIQLDLEKYTTPAYRSPEMVDLYSNRGSINTKSDIWALGILLYKLAYFITPFGDSILAIQSHCKRVEPPAANSSFSKEFLLLVNYLLIPDQDKRPDVTLVGEFLGDKMGVKVDVSFKSSGSSPMTFEEIGEYYEKLGGMSSGGIKINSSNNSSNKEVSGGVVSVTVTPRQRPKAGGGANQLDPSSNIVSGGGGSLMPPPKSPKGERKQQGQPAAAVAGSTPPSTTPTTNISNNSIQQPSLSSWNPFEDATDDDNPTTDAPTDDSTHPPVASSTDDPFANAPFDLFTYAPMSMNMMMMHFGPDSENNNSFYQEDHLSSSPNYYNPLLNPFLNNATEDDDEATDNNNVVAEDGPSKRTGVTNFSFSDE